MFVSVYACASVFMHGLWTSDIRSFEITHLISDQRLGRMKKNVQAFVLLIGFTAGPDLGSLIQTDIISHYTHSPKQTVAHSL